jgi:hypothetical protein
VFLPIDNYEVLYDTGFSVGLLQKNKTFESRRKEGQQMQPEDNNFSSREEEPMKRNFVTVLHD